MTRPHPSPGQNAVRVVWAVIAVALTGFWCWVAGALLLWREL